MGKKLRFDKGGLIDRWAGNTCLQMDWIDKYEEVDAVCKREREGEREKERERERQREREREWEREKSVTPMWTIFAYCHHLKLYR